MTPTLPTQEAQLIAVIRRLAGDGLGGLTRVGIGDDAAVLAVSPVDEETLVTTDQIIENTHFVMGMHPADKLGAKALARGVSDIAAMGGSPRWFALSLGLPKNLDFSWMEQFLIGMFSVIPTFAVPAFPLVGGDVARAPFFAANLTVAGGALAGRALLRSKAKPGDQMFVSGRLGGSALGLERLRAGAPLTDPAVERHCSPEPRLALGQALLRAGVEACLDLSDGLSTDAGRIAESSGVAVVIEPDLVPQFAEAGLERALHGGEEYELLFTAPPSIPIPSPLGGVAVTRIGRIEAGEGLWLDEGGEKQRLTPKGFDHFA